MSDQTPKAVCVLTKEGSTSVILSGTFPDCVTAMRKKAGGLKKPGEAVLQVFSRDGRYLTDDGHKAAYARQLEADKQKPGDPKPKKATKKKVAKKT